MPNISTRISNMIKYTKNWPKYLMYKFFTNREKPFVFETRAGNVAVPPRVMHTYKEVFFRAAYFHGIPDHVFSDDHIVVIDVGANVGFFSLFALQRFEHVNVYAFEPMPKNFKQLKTYYDRLDKENWSIENKAVSGKEGKITLHYDASDSFTTTASVHASDREPDTAVVEAVTLQNIVDKHGLGKIDLLKLDCEGSEYDILYNTSDELLKKVRSLTMETHPGDKENESHEAMISFLESKGYTVNNDDPPMLTAWR